MDAMVHDRSDQSDRRSGPSSWLGGLGLGLGSGGPLLGGGWGDAGGGSIADDIRNDGGLFFADDDPPPPSLYPPPARPQQPCHRPRGTGPAEPPPRRQSSASSLRCRPRRISSQQKMDDLQREVDVALEYFSRETEVELDHCDGDEYLEKLPRVDKVARFGHFRGGGEEDSLPGTAATSMATSVFTDDTSHDCFSDVHTKLLSYSSGHESPTDVLEAQTPPGGLSMKHKAKSIVSFPSQLLSSQPKLNCETEEEDGTRCSFENATAEELDKLPVADNGSVDFNSSPSLRNVMEPFLAVASESYCISSYLNFNSVMDVIEASKPADSHVVSNLSQGYGGRRRGSAYSTPLRTLYCPRGARGTRAGIFGTPRYRPTSSTSGARTASPTRLCGTRHPSYTMWSRSPSATYWPRPWAWTTCPCFMWTTR